MFNEGGTLMLPDTSWVGVGQAIVRRDVVAGMGPLRVSVEVGRMGSGEIEIPVGAAGVVHSSDGFNVNIEMSDGFIFHMMLGDFVAYFVPIGENPVSHPVEEMIQEWHPDMTEEGLRESVRWERSHGHCGDLDVGGLKFIGYWYRVKGDGYPDPLHYVDSGWSTEERDLVAGYLSSPDRMTLASWRGYSWCRLKCGVGIDGTRCMTDGVYAWPEGFVHYVREHSVKPPEEFLAHIRERT